MILRTSLFPGQTIDSASALQACDGLAQSHNADLEIETSAGLRHGDLNRTGKQHYVPVGTSYTLRTAADQKAVTADHCESRYAVRKQSEQQDE